MIDKKLQVKLYVSNILVPSTTPSLCPSGDMSEIPSGVAFHPSPLVLLPPKDPTGEARAGSKEGSGWAPCWLARQWIQDAWRHDGGSFPWRLRWDVGGGA